MFSVYAFTGIRRAEALALRVGDYDRFAKTLQLTKSKRSSVRMQHLPTILLQTLNEYLGNKIKDESYDRNLPLFPGNKPGIFLSCRQASNRFEKWKGISEIRKNLTIHSFRSGYATQLYKSSKDPLLVSFAMGHCSFNTTRRYINEEFFNFNAMLEKSFSK